MEQAGKKIASLLKASNALEKYLQEDGPLTPLEHQTIETTIMGLQTLLGSWTRKPARRSLPSCPSSRLGRQRDPDRDDRSAVGFALNGDLSAQRAHPFLHAGEAQAFFIIREGKAAAVI